MRTGNLPYIAILCASLLLAAASCLYAMTSANYGIDSDGVTAGGGVRASGN